MPAYAAAHQAPTVELNPPMPHVGEILDRFIELLADRVAERLQSLETVGDEWLDTRAAAEHLGIHRDTVRRLAAERAIRSEQDAPGCKLFFRRSELDAWRASTPQQLHAGAGTAR